MYYVYHLSIDGYIFYVGCTKRPVNRYKDHYHDVCSCVYKFSRYWITQGKVMSMTILSAWDSKEAATKEETNKISFYSQSYMLMNNEGWRKLFSQIIPPVLSLRISTIINKELISIKDQMKEYE